MTKTVVSIDVADVEKRRVPSKHYVYVINVKWSDGSTYVVYRRYSRFFDLQTQLLDKFPIWAGTVDPSQRIIPFLPGKIFFGRSQIRDVAMKRLGEIDAYCKNLLGLPQEISQCEEVLAFFEVEADDLDPPREDPKHKSNGEKKAEKISRPKQLEEYTVIADYEAQEKGEVDLKAGIVVEVVEKSESGWWFVHADEQQGWVPSTYLQPAQGSSGGHSAAPCAKDGEEESYICIERYDALNPDELTLEKGVIVQVVQKNMDGWWLVRYQGQEGIAPATYLKKSSDPHAISLVEKSRKSGVQIISNLAAVSNIMASSSSPRNSGNFVDSQRNSTASMPSIRNSAMSDCSSKVGDNDGAGADEDEWEDEDETLQELERDTGSKGDAYTKILMKQRSLERGGSLKPPPRQNSIMQMNVPVLPPPSAKPTSEYVTVAEFEDTVGDGISFVVGEYVTVLEKTSTGWWFVQRGEEEGWVPESFLEPASGTKAETNNELVSRPPAAPPKPPEKRASKPPALPSKPAEQSHGSSSKDNDGDEAARGSQVAGLASALKSKFDSKPAGLPTKPSDRSGAPPPPPKVLSTGDSSSELDGGPLAGGAGVAGLANVLKSKFEARQQHQQDDKPATPFSKPAPPAKTPGGGRPAPPQKSGGVPPKPGQIQKSLLPVKNFGGLAASGAGSDESSSQPNKFGLPKKPTLPFKKNAGGSVSDDVDESSSQPQKPQPPPPPKPAGGASKPSSGPSKLPSGPPKLPSGPPKLPSKPTGPKHSADSSKKSNIDIPPSTIKVSNMAAAFGAAQNKSDGNGSRLSLPGKNQPPAQKPITEGANRPKVGNLVSELSGKLQFGGGGGGGSGPKFRSPEPSPVSKTGPWSGQEVDIDAPKAVPVFPGMAAKPPGATTSAKSKPAPNSSSGSKNTAQYEVVADYTATNEGEVNLVCGDVVEVLDKQDEWWLVNSGRVEGWAPSSYLQPVSSGSVTPSASPKLAAGGRVVYRTVCAFTAQSEQELGFDKGQEVAVLEEMDTGWWCIEYNGQQGWAPADYIVKENA